MLGYSEEDKEKSGLEFLIFCNCDVIIVYVEVVSDEYLVKLNKGKILIYLISCYVD